MVIPKWGVILLWSLTSMGLLGGAGLYWISWPTQASLDFVDAIVEGRWDGFPTEIQRRVLTSATREFVPGESPIEFAPRTVADYFHGRKRFIVEGIPYDFQAERGTIKIVRCEIAVLIDSAKAYYQDRALAKAEAVARLACDEDPENPAAIAMLYKAKIERALESNPDAHAGFTIGCFECQ